MKIIYPNGSGGICVVHPTGELPIEQVAFKDVPNGVPYRFVADEEIDGLDRAYRAAWIVPEGTFDTPDGIGGVE